MSRTIELLRLLGVCDRIDGRKKLQKIVHILRERGYPFAYRYGFHFHGPFSAELKGEIDALVAENLIDEQEGGTVSGEFKQYTYGLSNSAQSVLDSFGGGGRPTWADFALELNAKPAQELEAISTIVFLIRSGYNGTKLQERFSQLKPHLVAHFDAASELARHVVVTRSPQTA